MDEFWGAVVVLLLVLAPALAAGARLALYYLRHQGAARHRRVLLSEALGALKTGDIVLFIYQAHCFTNSVLTSDLYSHGGVVVVEGGAACLAETHPDPQGGPGSAGGAQVTPLARRLAAYPGMYFLMTLERPLPPARAAALCARAREPCAYPSAWEVVRGALGFPAAGTRHCFEQVALLLDAAGLAPDGGGPPPLSAAGYFGVSRAVTGLPGVPLGAAAGAPNRYLEPVQLLYDLDVEPPPGCAPPEDHRAPEGREEARGGRAPEKHRERAQGGRANWSGAGGPSA